MVRALLSERLISIDINGLSFVNVYLQSGTDQDSRTEREEYVSNIPNLLLYKKNDGIFGGDMNSIVGKKESLIIQNRKCQSASKS